MRSPLPLLLLAFACGQPVPVPRDDVLADASPPSLQAPCTPAADPCTPPLACTPVGESGLCTLPCGDSSTCPDGSACAEGQCTWSTGTVAAPCGDNAPCHPGLACADLGSGAWCTRPCDYLTPCPQGENARCVKLSQGDAWCLRNCGDEEDCPEGLTCTPLEAAPTLSVCFP
jgi:hypothetical protein